MLALSCETDFNTGRTAREDLIMKAMPAGVMPEGVGIDGISWNILGQTYIPKQISDSTFSWHATFPPGTFVPPHFHPDQDEFIYVLNGRFDLMVAGEDKSATNDELIVLPRNIPHGIFNKSDAPVTCFFWVTPTGPLVDLFTKINNVSDPQEVVRLAGQHGVEFLPPPDGQ
jgi:quercetin dioxygenase-like cupin family protein